MEDVRRTGVLDLEREFPQLHREGPVDRLVRLTARLCSILRSANRRSWFAQEVREQVAELHEDLRECLRDGPLVIELRPQRIRLGNARLDDPPRAVRQLVQMFQRKGFGAVGFREGLEELELVVLCQILQSKSARPDSRDLQELECIELRPLDDNGTSDRSRPDRPSGPQIIRRSRLGEVVGQAEGEDDEGVRDLVGEITGAIDSITAKCDPVPYPLAPTTHPASGSGLLELVDDLGSTAEIALILSSLRRHDEYTYDHSINVGLLSICLAQALGWRGRDLHEFGIAALIHDVGKLYTPVEVLNKPGRLSPQEWIVMKRHPRDGYDILREGGSGSPDAPLIALEHHIGPDGRGYPSLAHKGMHPGSEIVKIADVYDAFTTIRPYRSQSRPQEVLKLLRKQAGRQFNAEYVEVFCEMMGEYPIGSTVKLRSGRIGLVVDVHLDDPKRPLVRILQDENGRRPRNMVLADLRHEEPDTGLHADEILETLDPVIRNIPIGRYI